MAGEQRLLRRGGADQLQIAVIFVHLAGADLERGNARQPRQFGKQLRRERGFGPGRIDMHQKRQPARLTDAVKYSMTWLGRKPKRSQWCGGMMSSAAAPASLAQPACSTASLMPSQTIEETTGHSPSTAFATTRVISARSRGVKAKTRRCDRWSSCRPRPVGWQASGRNRPIRRCRRCHHGEAVRPSRE